MIIQLKMLLILLAAAAIAAPVQTGITTPRVAPPKVIEEIRKGPKKAPETAPSGSVAVTDKASESRLVRTEALVYSGCLPGDSYWAIPVQAGQKVLVNASINPTCDSRGWTNDNFATSCGPNGRPGYYVPGSPGFPSMPIGYLMAGINANDFSSLSQDNWLRVFTPALPVDSNAVWDIPINGFFYLMMNDTFSYGDNKGSILVTVTILPPGT